MRFIPEDFWPEIPLQDDDETPDYAAIVLECAIVLAVCLLVAGFAGLALGVLWGWLT